MITIRWKRVLAYCAPFDRNTVKILTDHYIEIVAGSDEAINASMDKFYGGDSSEGGRTNARDQLCTTRLIEMPVRNN
jgi:hypothetical protein